MAATPNPMGSRRRLSSGSMNAALAELRALIVLKSLRPCTSAPPPAPQRRKRRSIVFGAAATPMPRLAQSMIARDHESRHRRRWRQVMIDTKSTSSGFLRQFKEFQMADRRARASIMDVEANSISPSSASATARAFTRYWSFLVGSGQVSSLRLGCRFRYGLVVRLSIPFQMGRSAPMFRLPCSKRQVQQCIRSVQSVHAKTSAMALRSGALIALAS